MFVHGWTCDSSSWTGQVPALAKQYRVITLDLPGHGKSGSPKDGKFSMDLFARAVEAVRAEAKAERIVLVGHSMGSPVIRRSARSIRSASPGSWRWMVRSTCARFRRPEFKGPPPPMTGPEGLKTREGMIRSMFTPQTPVPLQKHILSMMLAAPEATANGAMASIFDPSLRSTDVIKAPALAVFAGTAQVANVQTTKEIFPNYESAQLAGTGHFLMMENPRSSTAC